MLAARSFVQTAARAIRLDCLARQARSARIARGKPLSSSLACGQHDCEVSAVDGCWPLARSSRQRRARSGWIASIAKLAASMARARCDVRRGAAVFVGSDETIVSENRLCSRLVSSAPPADRRREHRGADRALKAAAFLTRSLPAVRG